MKYYAEEKKIQICVQIGKDLQVHCVGKKKKK